MHNKVKYGVLIALFLGGICLVVGFFVQEPKLVSTLFNSIGGAIAGAAMSAGVGYVLTRDIESEIKQIVKEGYENSLELDEKIISDYRKKYYLYHVTSIDGNFVWRLAILDFKESTAFGKLITKATTIQDGLKFQYSYKGHIKTNDKRLILCSTRANEPSGIYVFPEFGDDRQTLSSGIACIHTWDSHNSFSQCVLSANPLNDDDEKQAANTVTTMDEKYFKSMNTHWKNNLKSRLYHILPLIYHKDNTYKVTDYNI